MVCPPRHATRGARRECAGSRAVWDHWRRTRCGQRTEVHVGGLRLHRRHVYTLRAHELGDAVKDHTTGLHGKHDPPPISLLACLSGSTSLSNTPSV